MRVQWELLLALFIINLSIGLVMGLALPGTAQVANNQPITNATQYEQQFNSSKIETWGGKGNPLQGIPVIGDIFGGFLFLTQNIQFLIDGLPSLLTYLEHAYITDSSAQLAFEVIANVLRAIYAFLIMIFLIEFISGRYMSD
jgi:hypothetical protein